MPKRDLIAVLPPTMPLQQAAQYLAVETAHLLAVCEAGQGPMYVGIGLGDGYLPYFRAIDLLDFVGAPVPERKMDA